MEKAVIAGTIGAASGAIGAGIIAPLATTIGSGVGAAASYVLGPISSTAVTRQTSATLAVGATLSAASNVGLSATQDTLTQISDGKSVTLQTFQDSVATNWRDDAFYGAVGFVAGYGISGAIDDAFWQPSKNIAHLLDMHPAQKLIIGSLQASGQAISNSTLLEPIGNTIGR